MSKHTPGPWYVVDTEGSDSTIISRKPKPSDGQDSSLEDEVLGTSEWIRATTNKLKYLIDKAEGTL